MEHSDIRIRFAVLDDAEAILNIYAYYVEHTVITFEYDVPGTDEFRSRMERTLKRYPYLVAVKNNEILGYAYTGAFVGRAAYDWAVETTIYLKPDCRKMGVGKMLYDALEKISAAQNITNMCACIGQPIVEDEYLTNNSVDFHAHIGFRMVGSFYKCGYKFGRWYNMVWMEKIIQEHKQPAPPVIACPDLSRETLLALGIDR